MGNELDRAYGQLMAAAYKLRPLCTRAPIHQDGGMVLQILADIRDAEKEIRRVATKIRRAA